MAPKIFPKGYKPTRAEVRKIRPFVSAGREVKQCSGCLEVKSTNDFYKRGAGSSKNINGKSYFRKSCPFAKCKVCSDRNILAWQKANPERAKQHRIDAHRRWVEKDPIDRSMRWRLSRSRSLGKAEGHLGCLATVEYIRKVFEKCNGLCQSCGKPPKTKKGLHLDHCHKTGRFRGFICHNCNVVVGLVEEDVKNLYKIINYVKRTKGGEYGKEKTS